MDIATQDHAGTGGFCQLSGLRHKMQYVLTTLELQLMVVRTSKLTEPIIAGWHL
jgi:hypothetical protein